MAEGGTWFESRIARFRRAAADVPRAVTAFILSSVYVTKQQTGKQMIFLYDDSQRTILNAIFEGVV